MSKSGWTRACAFLFASALFLPACGGDEKFKNDPRPPAPVQITGVITDEKVTISPNRVGEGPVVLIVSNQSEEAHTVTLEGGGTTDRVGPINPLDTAKLQQTLKQGEYTVKAGSPKATSIEISDGTLTVGPPRESSGNQLLLP
jgi:hypothetical protein